MMKIKAILICLGLVAWAGCNTSVTESETNLLNTTHLDFLFEGFEGGNGEDLGAIWIYCEAPEYVLTDDDDEGYTCVDDVARSLVFYVKQFRSVPDPEILEKIRLLTEFILYMQDDTGLFFNFLLPDKSINKEHKNSLAIPNWWSWRAFWALSELLLVENESLRTLQDRCRSAIDSLLPHVYQFCSDASGLTDVEGIPLPICFTQTGADQAAIILIGLTNYHHMNPSEEAREMIIYLGGLLVNTQVGSKDLFPYGAFFSWKNVWHAWGNSQAYALLLAGSEIDQQVFIDAGLKEVRHFYPYVIEQNFINEFAVVEDSGVLKAENSRQFAQIAYGIRPMVYAALEAFRVSGDPAYARTAGQLATWFFGNNPTGQAIYDPSTGRTFDGIQGPTEINVNSGAESTVEGLLTIQAAMANEVSEGIIRKYLGQIETSE